MKNVHIIPTDKPSRLWTNNLRRRLELDKFPEQHPTNIAKHIYITNHEEIKDVRPHKGKWQLEQGQILNKFPTYLTDLSECKLVIMTTDQDLIKDGVQAIDDDFLEWFVKNPSCEEVEVMQQEELKQEITLEEKSVTAVEWFFSELERMQYFIGNDMLQAFEQAKEIEKQITPITPEALIELGFIDTSYADLGITFTEFRYYYELFEIQVYGDNVVDLKLGSDWQSTNANTIEDIKHLIRLFA